MLPLLLASFLAAAQEDPTPEAPSPARLCADAAEGTAVEVCLRLAAENPDAVHGIAAALRAHIDRESSGDRSLLQATLLLLSDDDALQGAAALGRLEDARAIAPLVQAVLTRDLDVAIAAVDALANHREGLEPLSGWLLDARLPLEVRRAAARSLGVLGADEGADAMLSALRRRGVPPLLRQEMIAVIEDRFPLRREELGRMVTADGRLWLTAGGAWGLGYTLAAAGHFGRTNLTALGGVTGAVAGGTAAWVTASAWPMEADDAAFIGTSIVLGSIGGLFAGQGVVTRPESREDAAWAGGLIGEIAGASLGIALRKQHQGTPVDALEATMFSAASATALGTLAGFVFQPERLGEPQPGVHIPALTTGIGFLGGAVAGHILAPRIHPSRGDAWLIALGASYGASVGALLPVGDLRRRSLPFTGLSVGLLTAYALSGSVEPDRDTLVGGLIGLGFGGGVGYGVGRIIEDGATDTEVVRGAALAGGTLGLAIGAGVAQLNPDPVDPRDVVLASLVTGWAAWQAGGWGVWADAFPGSRFDGLAFVVPAVAGIGVGLASPLLDVPIDYSFSAVSLGLWGGYVGGFSAELAGGDTLLFTLIGSNIGLLAGIVAASPVLDAPPIVIGLADGGGVLGGALFALGTSFLTNDVDAILVSSIVGAGLGFIGGAILGGALHDKTRDVAFAPHLPGRWEAAPWAATDGHSGYYGVQLRVSDW